MLCATPKALLRIQTFNNVNVQDKHTLRYGKVVIMAMPEQYKAEGIALDEEANDVVLRCPKCNNYGPKRIDADEYDSEEKLLNQAKRQLGSHYAQVHGDNEGGQGGSTSPQEGSPPSQGSQGQQRQGGNNPQSPQGQPQGGEAPPDQAQQQGQDYGGEVNERELIYRKGDEGLLELKAERLRDWLQDANGVGGQTESRIVRVFERNESVHSNPYALYNLLDDETSASPSYINTMVDDVFEPERQHEDLLKDQGYTPWFERTNGGGSFSQGSQRMMGGQQRSPQGGGMGGPPQRGGRQSQQYSSPQQQQAQQPQQESRRSQESDSGSDLSREEVAQMVTRGVRTAQEESEENPFVDGLSEATDEAIREMASNVGGLAGTANRVFEEALMNYAQENPEFIIENMDILQNVLGAAQGPEGGQQQQQQKQPSHTQQVDAAMQQIKQQQGGQQQQPQTGGGQPRQPQQQQQRQQRNPQHQTQQQSRNQQKEPESDSEPDVDFEDNVGPEESEYSPPSEVDPQTDEPEEKSSEPDGVEEVSEPPEQKPSPKPREESSSDEQNSSQSDKEDGFDDIFGDMAE